MMASSRSLTLWLLAACIAGCCAQGNFSFTQDIRSGRLWREYQRLYYPVLTSGWNYNAALHACSELGHGPPSDYETALLSNSLLITRFTVTTVTTNKTCYSLEKHFSVACGGSLASCTSPSFSLQQSHTPAGSRQIRLSCYEKQLPVQLVDAAGQTGRHFGRVQVQHGNRFGWVCGAGWTDVEAATTCRQLGYGSGTVLTKASALNATDVPRPDPQHGEHGIVQGFKCRGPETHLSQCPHHASRSWESTPCKTLATVVCSMDAVAPPSGSTPAASPTQLRLHPSRTSGLAWRREPTSVFHPISLHHWNYNTALDACRSRQLGPPYDWESSFRSSYSRVGRDSTNTSVRSSALHYRVQCGASETCQSATYKLRPTAQFVDVRQAMVNCFDRPLRIRLVSASGDTHLPYGLLEVEHNGAFRPVCGGGWSETGARVACRELGHGPGHVLHDGLNASLPDRPLVRAVFPTEGVVGGLECSGTEANVSLCRHVGRRAWQTVPCATQAAVVCGSFDQQSTAPTVGPKETTAPTEEDQQSTAPTVGPKETTAPTEEGSTEAGRLSATTPLMPYFIGLAALGALFLVSLILNIILICRARRSSANHSVDGPRKSRTGHTRLTMCFSAASDIEHGSPEVSDSPAQGKEIRYVDASSVAVSPAELSKPHDETDRDGETYCDPHGVSFSKSRHTQHSGTHIDVFEHSI